MRPGLLPIIITQRTSTSPKPHNNIITDRHDTNTLFTLITDQGDPHTVPSMANSNALVPNKPTHEATPNLPHAYILGITIFINDTRIAYRPRLWPTATAADLAAEARLVTADAMADAGCRTMSGGDLLLEGAAAEVHVFVRLEGARGVYLRTMEEVEGDENLWEEILDCEFPWRHGTVPRGEEARGEDSGIQGGGEAKLVASKSV